MVKEKIFPRRNKLDGWELDGEDLVSGDEEIIQLDEEDSGKTSIAEKKLSAFRPGQKVKHRTFGSGRIIKVSPGLIEVNFVKEGHKKLDPYVAPLEKE